MAERFTDNERRELMKSFSTEPKCAFQAPEQYLIDAYMAAYDEGYTEDQIKCIIQTEYTAHADKLITDGQYYKWLPYFYMAVRKANQERFKNGGLFRHKTQALEERMILAVSCGTSKEDAARMLGIPAGVLNVWMDQDEEFKLNLEHATSVANSLVQQALFKRASGFTRYVRSVSKTESEVAGVISKTKTETSKEEFVPPSVDAIKFWLINRNSSNFNLTGDITDATQKSKILEAIDKMSEMTEADYTELKNDQTSE
jgi:hypothetical protein